MKGCEELMTELQWFYTALQKKSGNNTLKARALEGPPAQ
jgi:hypothetical protein